jgi:hypothetical protein
VTAPRVFVLIDFADEEMKEITNVTGPFASEEDADRWDEDTGQRWGAHLIVPLYSPEEGTT